MPALSFQMSKNSSFGRRECQCQIWAKVILLRMYRARIKRMRTIADAEKTGRLLKCFWSEARNLQQLLPGQKRSVRIGARQCR